MSPNDVHLVFDDTHNRLKVFTGDGHLVFMCEARNETVRPGQFGRWGPCPRGGFSLGQPRPKNSPPFGPFFIPVLSLPRAESRRGGPPRPPRAARYGIGLHGGGSGLPGPLAPYQGWVPTHGCIRLQNAPLCRLVALLHDCGRQGGTAYLTVSGDAS